MKNVSINMILSLIEDQYRIKAEKKNIGLSCSSSLSDNDSYVITDETKLIQILSNLVNNAVKFTFKGEVAIVCYKKENNLLFSVKDTGIGIDESMHDDIFIRFRQVETTLARQFGGSGLGLSISRAYVELLGGEIWVDSSLGKGAAFYFTLPYKQE